MDLEGSLVDTNLRILPTSKLIKFLKSLPIEDTVPINIMKLVKDDYEPKHKLDIDHSKRIPIHLNSKDIAHINKIKETFKVENTRDAEVLEDEVVQKQKKVELLTSKLYKTNKDISKDIKQLEDKAKSNLCEQDPNVDIKTSTKDSTEKTKKSKEECNEKLKEECTVEKTNENSKNKELFLTTTDIDWLYDYLQTSKSKGDDVPYLHELLDGTEINMPQNRVIKRNPVLEARCVKLRAQQEAREYRKMTKSVDNVRMRFPEDSISFQLKQVNRHLIAIGQFIISIFAGFLFGFKGVEWMIGPLDFGFRLLLGVMCALIISLAEIYFLAKKLNEELNIPETVQLGGPPKFVDQQKHYEEKVRNKAIDKEHQD